MSLTSLNINIKCLRCEEFPTSPIRKCFNGHNICGICINKIDQCPECDQLRKQFVPDVRAERLAIDLKHLVRCKNEVESCGLMIQTNRMQEHLKSSCRFRMIPCIFHHCHEENLLENLYFHLSDDHSVPTIPYVENRKFKITNYMNSFDFRIHKPLTLHAMHYDGHVFIRHRIIQTCHVHQWISIIGDSTVAAKYRCMIHLPRIDNRNRNASWGRRMLNRLSKFFRKREEEEPEMETLFLYTLDIVPVDESGFAAVNKIGESVVAKITFSHLLPLCEEVRHQGTPYKFVYSDYIEFSRVI